MPDITLINCHIQEQLRKRGLMEVTAMEAAEWLDRFGILADSTSRSGLPLRKLLRAGKIVGQRQEGNRRWYIEKREKTSRQDCSVAPEAEERSCEADGGEVLADILDPGLRVVFVGTSVGDTSAARKRYYAHAGNQFYHELANAELTPKRLSPELDETLPQYGIGLTDIVKSRQASDDRLLNQAELSAGVADFRRKIAKYKPASICFNGKQAYKSSDGRANTFGETGERIEIARVFVTPSTSGRVSAKRMFQGKTRSEWFQELARLLKY